MLTEKCSHRMHINDMLQGQITNPSQGYTCYREAGIVNTKITFNDHSIYTHKVASCYNVLDKNLISKFIEYKHEYRITVSNISISISNIVT